MNTPTPLRSAIAFAHRGHPVLPLYWPKEDGSCSCGNPSCTGNSRGKHPFAPLVPNGKDNATTDLPAIKAWFAEYPLLNAGVTTDRFAVVDIDPRSGGRESWPKLVGTRHGEVHSWRVRTGSGGDHIYLDTGEHPLPSGKLARGVDLKAQKGYVVVPGSLHFSGKRYIWFADCHPSDTKLAPAPQWIRNLAERGTWESTKRSWEYYQSLLAPAGNGERHDRVAKLLGHLFGSAFPNRALLLELVISHVAHTYPDLADFPPEEIIAIAEGLCRSEDRKRGAGEKVL